MSSTASRTALRTMLAGLDAVQTWLGAEDATEALASIYSEALPPPAANGRYTADELDDYRPYILVWRDTHTIGRESTTGGWTSGTFHCLFVESIATELIADLAASSTTFEAAIDGILEELWAAAQVTAGALPITQTTILEGPERPAPQDLPEQGHCHAVLISVSF